MQPAVAAGTSPQRTERQEARLVQARQACQDHLYAAEEALNRALRRAQRSGLGGEPLRVLHAAMAALQRAISAVEELAVTEQERAARRAPRKGRRPAAGSAPKGARGRAATRGEGAGRRQPATAAKPLAGVAPTSRPASGQGGRRAAPATPPGKGKASPQLPLDAYLAPTPGAPRGARGGAPSRAGKATPKEGVAPAAPPRRRRRAAPPQAPLPLELPVDAPGQPPPVRGKQAGGRAARPAPSAPAPGAARRRPQRPRKAKDAAAL